MPACSRSPSRPRPTTPRAIAGSSSPPCARRRPWRIDEHAGLFRRGPRKDGDWHLEDREPVPVSCEGVSGPGLQRLYVIPLGAEDGLAVAAEPAIELRGVDAAEVDVEPQV